MLLSKSPSHREGLGRVSEAVPRMRVRRAESRTGAGFALARASPWRGCAWLGPPALAWAEERAERARASPWLGLRPGAAAPGSGLRPWRGQSRGDPAGRASLSALSIRFNRGRVCEVAPLSPSRREGLGRVSEAAPRMRVRRAESRTARASPWLGLRPGAAAPGSGLRPWRGQSRGDPAGRASLSALSIRFNRGRVCEVAPLSPSRREGLGRVSEAAPRMRVRRAESRTGAGFALARASPWRGCAWLGPSALAWAEQRRPSRSRVSLCSLHPIQPRKSLRGRPSEPLPQGGVGEGQRGRTQNESEKSREQNGRGLRPGSGFALARLRLARAFGPGVGRAEATQQVARLSLLSPSDSTAEESARSPL